MSNRSSSLSLIISRYYWLQVLLIAAAVIVGVIASALIIRKLLIHEALKQEVVHYWELYDQDINAPLPNTKNLIGYLWQNDDIPEHLNHIALDSGISNQMIDGAENITIYDRRDNLNLLLVFKHSNVDRLIWLNGIAPLILSLLLLYSVLWFIKLKTHKKISPISQLTERIKELDLKAEQLLTQPFQDINTQSNIEAIDLKKALSHYHHSLTKFIRREQQFTSEVSHELRTPLSVIKGSVQILQLKYGEKEKALLRIDRNIKDMEVIIETLFCIARQGADWLETDRTDLNKVVIKLQNELDDLSLHKRMKINVIEHEKNSANLNETLAYIVFSNLIRNALLYSDGTEVNIEVFSKKIIIEDNGQGIIEENRFKHDKRDKSHTGLGIGLTLVRRICKQLNWKMNLENTIGKGVKITLSMK